tara:strand:- start:3392 stop:4153 length:762 start_codon:yes stop_codon:yes gene_type:complete
MSNGRRQPPNNPIGNIGRAVVDAHSALIRHPVHAVNAADNVARWFQGDAGEGYRSTASARSGAAEAQGRRDTLRGEAVAAQRERIANAQRAIREGEAQAQDNQRAIQQGASRAFAAGLDPTTASGGGSFAAAGQLGMQAEEAGISQKARDMKMIQGMRERAVDAKLSAAEYEAQQGNEQEEYQAALAQGITEAEQAIQDGQGFWDDDEEGMMRTIRSAVARLRATNPRAAEELERKYLHPSGEGYKRIHSWWD